MKLRVHIRSSKSFETDLLVKAFKFPNTLTKIIYFIPPPQTNQNTATHVLNYPKIKSRKKHSHHKKDDKAIKKQSREYVKCQSSCLQKKETEECYLVLFKLNQRSKLVNTNWMSHTLKRT